MSKYRGEDEPYIQPKPRTLALEQTGEEFSKAMKDGERRFKRVKELTKK
jgi:hypothetical protein